MAKILSFNQKNNPSEIIPDYTGRILALNREKANSFQCGGFFVGTRRMFSVVEPDAQMENIHRALQNGVLIDITDSDRTLVVGGTEMAAASDLGDTGKRAYITASGAVIMTEAPDQIEYIERQIADGPLISLPPGMDDPDKYLIGA